MAYENIETEYESCTICRERFQSNSIVRKLQCGHIFHIGCIDTWFENNIRCPVCRSDLRDYQSNEEEDDGDNEEETNFGEDFDESAMLAKLTGSSSIEEEEKPAPVPKKVKVRKAVKAKKKSFWGIRMTRSYSRMESQSLHLENIQARRSHSSIRTTLDMQNGWCLNRVLLIRPRETESSSITSNRRRTFRYRLPWHDFTPVSQM